MILEMYMKNCALIEESRLTINDGLNILTGETGAGKSIIIEALGLCLGEKYDRSFLRKGTDKGVCEIVVLSNSSNLKEVLEKYDIDYQICDNKQFNLKNLNKPKEKKLSLLKKNYRA